MKLKIRYNTLVEIILGIILFGGLIISTLNLSNAIYYVVDAINIVLFLFTLKKVFKKGKIRLNRVNRIILGLIVSTLIGIAINSVSIKLILWGARNIFRYFLFYFSCIVLLCKEDVNKILDIILKVFWINLVLTIIQFGVLKIKGDYLGGIFGTKQGCNGATSIFINIVLAMIISKYLNKEINLKSTLLYMISYFIIAALTETKGNFVFFVIIVAVALLIMKKSSRTIFFGVSAIFALIIGFNILVMCFPNSLGIILNLEKANQYMDATYFGTTTFTRNASLEVANKEFFKDDLLLYLFGFGIGNCDTSSYFSSPFYEKYGYMNYRQMTSSMTVLQLGYVGLILYLLFFAELFIYFWKKSTTIKVKEQNIYMAMAAILSVFAIVYSFYATVYIEAGYLLFFALAIPNVLLKNAERDENIE